MKTGFHHVLTELAFLRLRYDFPDANVETRIIPISLHLDDRLGYIEFLGNLGVGLKVDPPNCVAPQHKVFFQLLARLYQSPVVTEIIKAFHSCCNAGRGGLEVESGITPDIFSKISKEETFRTLDELGRSKEAVIRNMDWQSRESGKCSCGLK